ncbi:hypothetical protein [Trinickia sp.]|uniref:hypothetical protein n=1 Tax=Trinickia sp. TaxID=2571163 RepID=UPI003F7E009D
MVERDRTSAAFGLKGKPPVSRIGAALGAIGSLTLSRPITQRGFVPIFVDLFQASY